MDSSGKKKTEKASPQSYACHVISLSFGVIIISSIQDMQTRFPGGWKGSGDLLCSIGKIALCLISVVVQRKIDFSRLSNSYAERGRSLTNVFNCLWPTCQISFLWLGGSSDGEIFVMFSCDKLAHHLQRKAKLGVRVQVPFSLCEWRGFYLFPRSDHPFHLFWTNFYSLSTTLFIQ